MPAGSTYTPIATTTLGSSTQYITFSSISGSYTDLVLVFANPSGASTALPFDLRVGNGSVDTGTNYSRTLLTGNGTAASSSRAATDGVLRFSSASLQQASGGNFIGTVHFMNYSNTTTFKTMLGRSNNADLGTDAAVNLWRSTSAINIIQVGNIGGGTMNSGVIATLYGIAAA
jgi:hypothetical protein